LREASLDPAQRAKPATQRTVRCESRDPVRRNFSWLRLVPRKYGRLQDASDRGGWAEPESNRRHRDFQPRALPPELPARTREPLGPQKLLRRNILQRRTRRQGSVGVAAGNVRAIPFACRARRTLSSPPASKNPAGASRRGVRLTPRRATEDNPSGRALRRHGHGNPQNQRARRVR
jgi:hypothetical protein